MCLCNLEISQDCFSWMFKMWGDQKTWAEKKLLESTALWPGVNEHRILLGAV